MTAPTIDTSSLLTMLGIIAAVWALIPATARMTFRLSFSRLDWALIFIGAVLIHLVVYNQVLQTFDLYPNLGPWIWGFDQNGVLYLMFLGLASYVYVRARTTRLSRRHLPLFGKLATSLLHGRKFEELGTLVEKHFETVLEMATHESARDRVATWIRPEEPMPSFMLSDRELVLQSPAPLPWMVRAWNSGRHSLAQAVSSDEIVKQRARLIVSTVLGSRAFVGYLARAYPYLCLRLMVPAQSIVDDFQDEFFAALLADESSIFFSEMKNNHNMAKGNRLLIPAENLLVSFYLHDVETAAKLGVYRSLGEAMLSTISNDRDLVERLNGPLVMYDEVGYHRCPIAAGVHFFRIMVLEGLHQRTFDHLWLHYVTHFTDRILKHARDTRPEDDWTEFPTPFSYLLYQIVDVAADWIEEAIDLTQVGDTVTQGQSEGRHIHISFEAASAVGLVMHSILRSPKVTKRLKEELFTVVLRTYSHVNRTERLAPLARAIEQAMVRPYDFRLTDDYLEILAQVYDEQDHVLRATTRELRAAIQEDFIE